MDNLQLTKLELLLVAVMLNKLFLLRLYLLFWALLAVLIVVHRAALSVIYCRLKNQLLNRVVNTAFYFAI